MAVKVSITTEIIPNVLAVRFVHLITPVLSICCCPSAEALDLLPDLCCMKCKISCRVKLGFTNSHCTRMYSPSVPFGIPSRNV